MVARSSTIAVDQQWHSLPAAFLWRLPAIDLISYRAAIFEIVHSYSQLKQASHCYDASPAATLILIVPHGGNDDSRNTNRS